MVTVVMTGVLIYFLVAVTKCLERNNLERIYLDSWFEGTHSGGKAWWFKWLLPAVAGT